VAVALVIQLWCGWVCAVLTFAVLLRIVAPTLFGEQYHGEGVDCEALPELPMEAIAHRILISVASISKYSAKPPQTPKRINLISFNRF
jgi:hypothetical protein